MFKDLPCSTMRLFLQGAPFEHASARLVLDAVGAIQAGKATSEGSPETNCLSRLEITEACAVPRRDS